MNDIVELHNGSLFVEHGVFPASMVQAERDRLLSLVPGVRRAEGVFFNALTESTFAAAISGVDYSYRSDVLDFLAKFKVFDRCSAAVVLGAFEGRPLPQRRRAELPGSGPRLRRGCAVAMLASVDTAELILSKHLLDDSHEAASPCRRACMPPIAAPCSMRTSTTRTRSELRAADRDRPR